MIEALVPILRVLVAILTEFHDQLTNVKLERRSVIERLNEVCMVKISPASGCL